ncbi:hypothetical protein BDQ17DRAFT_1331290 [Cyathus striatus]|nr:hypothetical protein BDQ17DRAFT_1331290 [Cyathus striatus]
MGSDFDNLMEQDDVTEDEVEVEQDTTGYYPMVLHNDDSSTSSEEEDEDEEEGGEGKQIAQLNSWPASSDFTLLVPNQRHTWNLRSSSQTELLQVPGPQMYSESSSAPTEASSRGHSQSLSMTTCSLKSTYSSESLDTLLKPVDRETPRKELLAQIKELQVAVGILRSERNQAFNHAVILAREHSDLAEQVNSKANKKKRKGVRANAELLTSTEATQRRDEQQAEEEAKAQKKAETIAQREERQHQVEE